MPPRPSSSWFRNPAISVPMRWSAVIRRRCTPPRGPRGGGQSLRMTADQRIGTEIAGFRIQEELGRGGMGVVYLAEQSSPRRRVALKILSPDLARDPAFRERFTRESEAAASVEHPNVIPVYASGDSDGVLFIAMR